MGIVGVNLGLRLREPPPDRYRYVGLREQASEIVCLHVQNTPCPATGKPGALPTASVAGSRHSKASTPLTSWLRSVPFTRQPGHHPPCAAISNSWPLGFIPDLASKVWRRYGDVPSAAPDARWQPCPRPWLIYFPTNTGPWYSPHGRMAARLAVGQQSVPCIPGQLDILYPTRCASLAHTPPARSPPVLSFSHPGRRL